MLKDILLAQQRPALMWEKTRQCPVETHAYISAGCWKTFHLISYHRTLCEYWIHSPTTFLVTFQHHFFALSRPIFVLHSYILSSFFGHLFKTSGFRLMTPKVPLDWMTVWIYKIMDQCRPTKQKFNLSIVSFFCTGVIWGSVEHDKVQPKG